MLAYGFLIGSNLCLHFCLRNCEVCSAISFLVLRISSPKGPLHLRHVDQCLEQNGFGIADQGVRCIQPRVASCCSNWQSLPWDRRLEVQNDRLFRCVMACWVDLSCERFPLAEKFHAQDAHNNNRYIGQELQEFYEVLWQASKRSGKETADEIKFNETKWNTSHMSRILSGRDSVKSPLNKWGGQKPYHDYFA